MIGKHWYSSYPKELYNFKYFKFIAPIGGHANDGPILQLCFESKEIDSFLKNISDLILIYPFAKCHLRKERNINIISIADYSLYDYDFLFAIEIEKIIEKFQFQIINYNSIPYIKEEFYRFVGEKIKDIPYYSLKSEHIHIHNMQDDAKYGSSTATVQVAIINKNHQNTLHILNELTKIGFDSNFQYLWVDKKEFKNIEFLSANATNGRQGLNFEPYHFSNMEKFEDGINRLFKKYNLVSKIQTNSFDEYNNTYPSSQTEIKVHKLIGDYDKVFE